MPKPTLYIFVGYPGAGKTTVAQSIQALTGAEHIWADKERREMFGTAYNIEQSQQLYSYLNQETENLLSAGKSVVFDTNFNYHRDREYLRSLAVKHDAGMRLIWLNTPKHISKRRAVGSRQYIDITEDEFEQTAAKLEPPTANEQPIIIDGTDVTEQTVKQQICGL